MDFDLPELTPETPAGVLCQVKVADLKPTQNAVGFDEVNDKIDRYSTKSKEDLKDYLLVHAVPVVIGNGGQFYLTDHHHLANALWKSAEGKNKAGIDNWTLKDEIRGSDILISNLPEEQKKEIIDEAMQWARSREARGMPGYNGPG